MAGGVVLRDAVAGDLPILFAQQQDPDAVRMAAVPARAKEAFEVHWATTLADETVIARIIVAGGEVPGDIGSFGPARVREVGFWIGRAFWGHGVATAALTAFLLDVSARPSTPTSRRPTAARSGYWGVVGSRSSARTGARAAIAAANTWPVAIEFRDRDGDRTAGRVAAIVLR